MSVTILAIETSCDDTAAAIIKDGQVCSNVVAGQEMHALYGGVVPELASRAHQVHVVRVVDAALARAGMDITDIQAVAFTRGPGLMGSLLVGVSFAKGLALSRGLPLIDVHHLHAHVLAQFATSRRPNFPFLSLLVSGGHTQIIRVDQPLSMTILGTTLDDAAGEAYDKAGKLLGLPYPAGPEIDRLAQQGKAVYPLPHPRLSGYEYSFSGLKTAIRNFLHQATTRDPQFINQNLPDICASIQHHIVEILLEKLIAAANDTGITHISLAGGVSANSRLRARFEETGRERGWETFVPPIAYSTDNAAMIGVAAYYKYLAGQFAGWDVTAEARLPFLPPTPTLP